MQVSSDSESWSGSHQESVDETRERIGGQPADEHVSESLAVSDAESVDTPSRRDRSSRHGRREKVSSRDVSKQSGRRSRNRSARAGHRSARSRSGRKKTPDSVKHSVVAESFVSSATSASAAAKPKELKEPKVAQTVFLASRDALVAKVSAARLKLVGEQGSSQSKMKAGTNHIKKEQYAEIGDDTPPILLELLKTLGVKLQKMETMVSMMTSGDLTSKNAEWEDHQKSIEALQTRCGETLETAKYIGKKVSGKEKSVKQTRRNFIERSTAKLKKAGHYFTW